MGLPWIKVKVALPSHPKSLALADELGEPLAWAYAVALWMWASEHAPDGFIHGAHPDRIVERAVGWRGEPGKLATALLAVGFLNRQSDAFAIQSWDEEQGAHIDKAATDAERKREARRTVKAKVAKRDPSLSRRSIQKDPARVRPRERSRSRINKPPPTPPPPQQAPLALVTTAEPAPVRQEGGQKLILRSHPTGGHEWVQEMRAVRGLEREEMDSRYPAFQLRMVAAHGEEAFFAGIGLYLDDGTIRAPGHPTSLFMQDAVGPPRIRAAAAKLNTRRHAR